MRVRVRIGAREVADDGLRLPRPTGYDDNQTGPCPDCGGVWVWYEAGYVPGTRHCSCGSFFNFAVEGGSWYLIRERFHYDA